jgi:hypothetical protein
LGHSVYLFQVKTVLELNITCVLGSDELCSHDFYCTSDYAGKRVEREGRKKGCAEESKVESRNCEASRKRERNRELE